MNPALSASLILFATTAALSAAITGLAVFVARRLQVLAHPVERSSHSVPTPQVGGVGICLALVAGLLVVPALANRFEPPHWSLSAVMCRYDTRGALILVLLLGLALGLVDDARHLAVLPKLLGQIVLAAVPLLAGISFANAAWPGASGSSVLAIGMWIGGPLAFLWILSFINVFNFMDGVDGQSGVFTLNALLWWTVIGLVQMKGGLAPQSFALRHIFLPLAAMGGAVLGFLFWNFPRARTFMGDSGSLPLGAALATMAAASSYYFLDVVVAFCFPLSLFVYDVLYTLARRIARRENIFEAHRSHLYQRLLIATGWPHTRLLAFHLPFYLLSGLAGAVYFSSFWESVCVSDHWFSFRGVRIACLLFLALLLLMYTLLVWRFEKRRKEAHAS